MALALALAPNTARRRDENGPDVSSSSSSSCARAETLSLARVATRRRDRPVARGDDDTDVVARAAPVERMLVVE
jgi:hypothetical protein